ncbi:hypothetical protein KUF54_09850 [Comamonas sp. Y33R10-2]|uniref:hypothetical protein n=1 Tax=Comamonas sp. Y33R10-2 TaxID=2853257 RepID=UPI001C5C8309|nr:hypothetical protein [Comamonas sp. Y33R10-2]QXZ08410.1 hypothetical protein KUF54_09850 [Comamonas sp. Y33R10-2]
MRQAHPFSFKAAALLIATASSLALAQAPKPAVPTAAEHSVFNPAAPTLPLQHQPLASSGAIVEQAGDWKAANSAVAAFARGHADVIEWEKAQSAANGKTPSAHPHPQRDKP